MKKIIKKIYVITCNNKESEAENIQEAESKKEFLEEFLNTTVTIKEKDKIAYEIEQGDKVYWKKDSIIIKNRIDIVTDIIKNAWGDLRYKTKEMNGDKIGIAYLKDICLVL